MLVDHASQVLGRADAGKRTSAGREPTAAKPEAGKMPGDTGMVGGRSKVQNNRPCGKSSKVSSFRKGENVYNFAAELEPVKPCGVPKKFQSNLFDLLSFKEAKSEPKKTETDPNRLLANDSFQAHNILTNTLLPGRDNENKPAKKPPAPKVPPAEYPSLLYDPIVGEYKSDKGRELEKKKGPKVEKFQKRLVHTESPRDYDVVKGVWSDRFAEKPEGLRKNSAEANANVQAERMRTQSRDAQKIAQQAATRQTKQLAHRQAQQPRAIGGAHPREVTDAPHGFNIINGVPLRPSGVTDFVPFPARENINPDSSHRRSKPNISGPAYEEFSSSRKEVLTSAVTNRLFPLMVAVTLDGSTTAEFTAACQRIRNVRDLIIMKLGALGCQRYHSTGKEAAALEEVYDQHVALLEAIMEHSSALTLAFKSRIKISVYFFVIQEACTTTRGPLSFRQ
ncbi:hypothetical protein KFL_002950130 [Klebsormidium nitens]|uniref:Uncharacterized protein n=2 Tax=Klebsormidium nitens TaxID=105231 RepID=A0A1Y1IBR4_KLENI|nr:hypothetical protein KFL_002950130 [Klebsormidium nitens]|eukprot:GAQ86541.1 hypothetical protein KFL_002950130 [Klebsormidium nitens]